jgi:hypothetical protein
MCRGGPARGGRAAERGGSRARRSRTKSRFLFAIVWNAQTPPAGRANKTTSVDAVSRGTSEVSATPLAAHATCDERSEFTSLGRGGACRDGQNALDRTSLTLSDRSQQRELGIVGKRWPARGLHVMSALGMDEHGTALGLLDQKWWAQTAAIGRRSGKSCGSKYRERETRYWFEALRDASHRLAERAPDATPWYQFDRGADCWPLLNLAVEREILVTVRSCHDRRLVDQRGRRRYLREPCKSRPSLGASSLSFQRPLIDPHARLVSRRERRA